MDVLVRLQKTLRNLNRVALSRIRPGDTLQLLNEQTKLKQWASGAAQLEDTTPTTIEAALRAYQQNGYLKGLRQIRLVCYGCSQTFGEDTGRLIENREHFDKLLGYVARYSDKRRSFRKLYRGLLSCYFSYDPDAPDSHPSGRHNWKLLRKFLSAHLHTLASGRITPEWIATLTAHPNLLDQEPCQHYLPLVFQGDWSLFNDIREHLEIGAGSWLIRNMVMTPVMAIGQMEDTAFKERLDNILLLLNDYPLYAATGLKVLLDRYAQCKNQDIDASLRDFAIGLWGNPWLSDQAHQWQCSTSARTMLAHWLKRHLLSEFFSLLSNDDKAHPRRFSFWDIYSADLTGMYFALSKDAFAPGNASLYQFRNLAKGLVTRLTEEKHDVHICIMQFEHYHVVEFNRDNNAAYFYDIRQGTPPFYLSKGWVEIGALSVANLTQGVGVTSLSKPLLHQDSKSLSWEGRFAQELGATENSIKAFCQRYQCQYDDRRNQDGRQWIRPSHPAQYGQEVWSVLRGWGFCLSPEQNGYFRLAAPDAA